MFLHGEKQLELGTGTLEIVARSLNLEVGITLEKIGKKAQG